MARSAISVMCVCAAFLAVGANRPGLPAEQLSTGNARPPPDHEFYRPAEAPPPIAFAPPGTNGGGRTPFDMIDWAETARRLAEWIGPGYAW